MSRYKLMRAIDMPDPWVLPSASIGINRALNGGFLSGRVHNIYGSKACLAGDTFIPYEIRDSDGRTQNFKGGTIEHLYSRFHKIPVSGKGYYQRSQTINSDYFLMSVDEESKELTTNKIIDVFKTGPKECFELLTETGNRIISSADHKFLTKEGFVRLQNLLIGDLLFIHNKSRLVKSSKKRPHRVELMVKHHPTASRKIVNGCEYYRLKRARAVVEAHLNGLSLNSYVELLNSDKNIENIITVDNSLHVHHIDLNPINDVIENLLVLTNSEHIKLHRKLENNKIIGSPYLATEDRIISISSVGVRETYDIAMESPRNNYVANKFVVHNSGKSTLVYHSLALAQEMGKRCLFVDTEGTFLKSRATACGVNLNELDMCFDKRAEDILTNVLPKLHKDEIDVLVIDSLNTVFFDAYFNDPEYKGIGTGARSMNFLTSKLLEGMDVFNTQIFIIAHVTMAQSGQTMSLQAKLSESVNHWIASQIKLRKDMSKKELNDESAKIYWRVDKSKWSNYPKEGEYHLYSDKDVRIDNFIELAHIAVELDIVEKNGPSWLVYGDLKFQGEQKFADALRNDQGLYQEILGLVNQ